MRRILSIALESHVDRAVTHHDDIGVFWQSLGNLNGSPDGVSGLQGGNNTLELSAQSECTESLLVVGDNVLGSARVLQPGVLGSDSLSGVGNARQSMCLWIISRSFGSSLGSLNQRKWNGSP